MDVASRDLAPVAPDVPIEVQLLAACDLKFTALLEAAARLGRMEAGAYTRPLLSST